MRSETTANNYIAPGRSAGMTLTHNSHTNLNTLLELNGQAVPATVLYNIVGYYIRTR